MRDEEAKTEAAGAGAWEEEEPVKATPTKFDGSQRREALGGDGCGRGATDSRDYLSSIGRGYRRCRDRSLESFIPDWGESSRKLYFSSLCQGKHSPEAACAAVEEKLEEKHHGGEKLLADLDELGDRNVARPDEKSTWYKIHGLSQTLPRKRDPGKLTSLLGKKMLEETKKRPDLYLGTVMQKHYTDSSLSGTKVQLCIYWQGRQGVTLWGVTNVMRNIIRTNIAEQCPLKELWD